MIQARGGLRFQTKAPQVRFRRPVPETDHLQRDNAIETLLTRAIKPRPARRV